MPQAQAGNAAFRGGQEIRLVLIAWKMTELIALRDLSALPNDPWPVFFNWLNAGLALPSGHPDAIALGTVQKNGAPAVRFVLHKSAEHGAIQFVTNFLSAKSKELERNPAAAITYYWREISRQIRVEGKVRRAVDAASDAYWQTRSRVSQIGAWASEQSAEIPSREYLDARAAEYEKKFSGQPVPRPPHWGMLELTPESFEFLHLQSARLHDRVVYAKKNGDWSRNYLAP